MSPPRPSYKKLTLRDEERQGTNDYGGRGPFQRGFRLIESQLKGVIKGRDQLHGSTKRGVRLIDSQLKVVGANFTEVSML